MRNIWVYIAVAIGIFVGYIFLSRWQVQQVTDRHEAKFNQTQALQTYLAAQSIEDHFDWLVTEIEVLSSYSLPVYLEGAMPGYALQAMLAAISIETAPEEPAIGFFTSPTEYQALYVEPTGMGQVAGGLLKGWMAEYWDNVALLAPDLYYVTPFAAHSDYQLHGLLFPVMHRGELAGIVGVVQNFAPMLERYVVPMRSGDYGAAWMQDADGVIIYDHQPEQIGQSVLDISRGYPSLNGVVNSMQIEDSGQAEYSFPVAPGRSAQRKLVAWDTAYLGNQRLTIALAAPDSEINEELQVYREQAIRLGVVLALTLVGTGTFVYLVRTRGLQRLVAERTRELEQLNAGLEERVASRTRELDQERAQLRAILDAMGDGLVYAAEGKVQYVNRVLVDLLGYEAAELESQPALFHEKVFFSMDEFERLRRNMMMPAPDGQVWRDEIRLRRKDGSEFDAGLSIARVGPSKDRPLGTVVLVRDISQEKALQEQKDRFITHASHELRTPLANLKTRLYLLRHQPEKVAEHARVLEQTTDQMVELVSDLLDVSLLERGVIRLRRGRVVLQDAFSPVVEPQQLLASQKELTLTIDLPDEPIVVFADAARLTQTFNKLLTDVIEFSDAGQSVTVRLYAARDDGRHWGVVRVVTSGLPIEPEALPRIFDPFFRASDGNLKGARLGLTIAQKVIDQHNGRITIEQVDSQGSAITIELPLFEAPAATSESADR